MTFTPTDYLPYDFANRRHIGPSPAEMAEMLAALGVETLDELIDQTVPQSIRQKEPLDFGKPKSERQLLYHMRQVAKKNRVFSTKITASAGAASMAPRSGRSMNVTVLPSAASSAGTVTRSDMSGLGWPFGRPKCASRTGLPPCSRIFRMVGATLSIRVESLTAEELEHPNVIVEPDGMITLRMLETLPGRADWTVSLAEDHSVAALERGTADPEPQDEALATPAPRVRPGTI